MLSQGYKILLILIMSKKNKSGNGHNKLASIGLLVLGLLLTVLSLMQPTLDYGIRYFLIGGIIITILGAILFKRSFLEK